MRTRPRILVIVGPTSAGKSGLAVRLAQRYNGEVISADSRQVYRGLNIGTGKITKREMRGVPHHLLDVASPRRTFTAEEFRKRAGEAIRDILARKKLPIVAGGTGFYIDALLGSIPLPNVPPRKELRLRLEKKTTGELLTMLARLDPRRAKEIDRRNRRRIIRAIEIARTLGRVPSFGKKRSPYLALKIGLLLPDKALKEKITIRLFARIRQGMVAEARRLHEKKLPWKRMRELGLEYRYLADYLTGKLTRKQFEEGLARAIWRYAKRQMRWFKRDTDIAWFTMSKVGGATPHEYKKITNTVERFITASEEPL
ncbi:MAG: tRNA (adenosine(37)-N6)-dimethylallyltransferase MiaA [Parcubacteria group bacterium]|nr:tRNA (adenosine(37)-N6)-dimethylallyltransferase MiaA [Parcubacteria group bacterium]